MSKYKIGDILTHMGFGTCVMVNPLALTVCFKRTDTNGRYGWTRDDYTHGVEDIYLLEDFFNEQYDRLVFWSCTYANLSDTGQGSIYSPLAFMENAVIRRRKQSA